MFLHSFFEVAVAKVNKTSSIHRPWSRQIYRKEYSGIEVEVAGKVMRWNLSVRVRVRAWVWVCGERGVYRIRLLFGRAPL